MEWIYPIRLDRYGLALEGESLEFLKEEAGLDIEEVEQSDLAWPALRGALKELSAADWERIVKGLDHETLILFREVLREHAEEAIRVMGSHKYALVRGCAFLHHLAHPQAQWKLTDPNGPIRLFVLRKEWGTSYPSKPRIPYYKLAKTLGASDKTIKEWDERMAVAGEPPKDDSLEYFCRVVKPPYKRKGGSA